MSEIAKKWALEYWDKEDQPNIRLHDFIQSAIDEALTEKQAELDALKEKARVYRTFFDRMMEECAEGGEFISDEVVDIAGALGLTRWLVYDNSNEVMREFIDNMPCMMENEDEFWYVVGSDPRMDALAEAVKD